MKNIMVSCSMETSALASGNVGGGGGKEVGKRKDYNSFSQAFNYHGLSSSDTAYYPWIPHNT